MGIPLYTSERELVLKVTVVRDDDPMSLNTESDNSSVVHTCVFPQQEKQESLFHSSYVR